MLPSVSHVNNDTSRKMPTDNQKIESPIAIELAKQAVSGTKQSTIKLVGLDIKTITSDDIQQIQNVDRLSLRKNQLVALPNCFANLKNLRYLDLNSNNLRDIPHILQQCPQLEILDLSCNKIKTLPLDISSYWNQNLKVLSLKNNRLTSVNDLRIILSLPKLNVLEIENNNIPKEELEMVQNYTPVATIIPKDEYWAVALRRYFEDHPERNIIPTSSALSSSSSALSSSASASVSSLNQDTNSKLSRASKRMGFINTTRSGSISSPIPHSPKQSSTESSSHQLMDTATQSSRRPPHHMDENMKSNNSIVSNLSLPTPTSQTSLTHSPNSSSHGHNTSGTELYNHTKYNDYFKRLSILPEETMVNEETKISKAELVAACRKLLFGFTECQQAVRKIASFCKDSSIAVNIVSLLYSVRTHIDSLVEILEEIENDESSNDQGLIKICITIISSFKQIITVLRKHFTTFFEEDDLCFIRMFYMTLLCSYTEIYNAWSFISTEFHSKKVKLQRKYPLKKEDSSVLSFVASSSVVSSSHNKSTIAEEKNPFEQNLANFNNSKHNIRVRSNTLQNKIGSNLPSTLMHTNSSNSDSSFNSTTVNEQISTEHHLPTQQQIKGNTNDTIARSRSNDNSPSSQHNIHAQDISRSASVHKIQRSESVAERDRLSSSPANNNIMRKTSISTQHPSVLKSTNAGHKKTGFKNKTDVVTDSSNIEPRTSSDIDRSRSNSANDTTTYVSTLMQRADSSNSGPSVSEVTEKRTQDHSSHSGNQVVVEATTNGEAEQNIDRQLYEMLINVTRMVSVVYDQLTNEISRIAMASTTGQQKLTDELLLRIRGLTDTCCQALDLAKTLNERLQLLVNDDPKIVEPYLTDNEKLVTWENINAFLKSIISILGSTKVVMTDLPNLNEIRPHLASLAKITKDVTVILDLSSYKAVSVTAAQIQKLQQQQQVQIQQQQQLQQQQQQQQIDSHTHVPLLTPQPMANNSTNSYPFDQ